MTAIAPQSEQEMIEQLTGIFEGGGYCTLADNPADTQGGLSYGKHQAAELQGSLVALLKVYVGRTEPPLPNPDFLAGIRQHLGCYNAAGTRYQGAPDQRAAYKQLLRQSCQDPAMQRAQDEYFKKVYFDPAMGHAADYGVATLLGRAIFYDIAIQAGPARLSFYRTALNGWNTANSCQAAACSPKDGAGPAEAAFLAAVNAARRAEMLASSSPAYRASVYRPDEFDKLLTDANFALDRDFVFKGRQIKGLLAA